MHYYKKIVSLFLILSFVVPVLGFTYDQEENTVEDQEDFYSRESDGYETEEDRIREENGYVIRPISEDEINFDENPVIINLDMVEEDGEMVLQSSVAARAGDYTISPARVTINQGEKVYFESNYRHISGIGWYQQEWVNYITGLRNIRVKGAGLDIIDWDISKDKNAYFEAMFFAPGTHEVYLLNYRNELPDQYSETAYITVRETTTKPMMTFYKTSMVEGESYTFRHDIYNGFYLDNGAHINDFAAYWESSNKAVATVDMWSGVVTAVGPGTTTITAESRDKSYILTTNLTVTAKQIDVTSISVSPLSQTLDIGETMTMTGTVSPSNATNKTITWTSSDASVASVDTTGLVTALASGKAEITAKSHNGLTAKSIITVADPFIAPESIELSSTLITIQKGDSAVLSAKILPENADITVDELVFSIEGYESNISIAGSGSERTVTGIEIGPGKVTVSLPAYGITAECDISVRRPYIHVEEVRVSMTETVLKPGIVYDLDYMVLPANATNPDPSIVIEPKGSNVAEITVHGEVYAKNPGQAKVVVTADGVSSSIDITVEAEEVPIASIEIEEGKYSRLSLGNEYVFTYKVLPEGADTTGITVLSTNPGKVKITEKDGNTILQALEAGTATIVVMAPGGAMKSIDITVLDTIPVEKVKIHLESSEFTVGNIYEFDYEVLPAAASNQNVMISTSNPNIVKYLGDNRLEAVSEGSSSLVIVPLDNPLLTASMDIKVVNGYVALESISVGAQDFERKITVGESFDITVLFNPENATNKNVTYMNLGTAYFDVDTTGRVRGKAPGSSAVMIISEEGNYMAFSNIEVKALSRAMEGQSYNERVFDLVMDMGETEDLNSEGEDLLWFSSNTDIIRINNGEITAKEAGYAVIAVMDREMNLVESFHVLVK